MPVSLRLRNPNGTSTISLPDLTATYADLQSAISTSASIPAEEQELRTGFPPKLLARDTTSSATLQQLGIRNGDSIIVAVGERIGAKSGVQAASPAPAPAPIVRAPAPVAPAPTPVRQPPPSPVKVPSKKSSGAEADYVEVEGGYLLLRVVPDDNSCLFRALALVLRVEVASSLRSIVADAIKADDETWSEAVLGQSRESYIQAILNSKTWGGAIELVILSKHFKVQIFSIDVQTGRVDKFGEEDAYPNKVFIIYSGIHYDAVTFSYLAPTPTSSSQYPPENLDFDTTQFDSYESDQYLTAALNLATKLRKRHAFTDAATFTLKCEDCGTALVGEKEAREHAKLKGHTRFGEYDG